MEEYNPNAKSFYYSILFMFVIFSDIIICIFMVLIALSLIFEGANLSKNTFNIYLVIVLLINFILDLIFLINSRKTPHLIDDHLCRIKSFFGIIGIMTIISGIYFGVISFKMYKVSYEIQWREKWRKSELERIRKEDELTKAQNEETDKNILKLEESGLFHYIENYIHKYPNSWRNTKEFNNLKELLGTKKFYLNDDELESILKWTFLSINFSELESKVLHNNPKTSDDLIRNYIELGENDEFSKLVISAILEEKFNYQGDIDKDIERIKKEIELKKFEDDLISETQTGHQFTINDIDNISGYDFEILLKRLFEKMGYQVMHTTLSQDQGADLVVEKFGVRTVIQAKNWANNVGNTAIQEVVAAIKYYDAQKAMVISSSEFTNAAVDLALSNNVELWDRSKLRKILNDNPIFKK